MWQVETITTFYPYVYTYNQQKAPDNHPLVPTLDCNGV